MNVSLQINMSFLTKTSPNGLPSQILILVTLQFLSSIFYLQTISNNIPPFSLFLRPLIYYYNLFIHKSILHCNFTYTSFNIRILTACTYPLCHFFLAQHSSIQIMVKLHQMKMSYWLKWNSNRYRIITSY